MKRLFSRLAKASLVIGVMIAAGCLGSGSAHAAPNEAPDQNYFSPYGNEQWMLTSHAYDPDLNYIDAPVSQVKLYSTTPNFSLTIHNPHVCRTDQSLDIPFRSTGSPVGSFTNFRVYPLGADEATPDRSSLLASFTGQSLNQADWAGCGAPVTLNFSIATPSTIPGHAGMYVAYFEAVFGGTIRGYNNRYRLSLSDPNGIIAYSDGSSVSQAYKFAIIPDRRPVELYGRATYWTTDVLPFGPSCDVTSPQNVQLRWFDDDYLQFNQGRTITMELQKFDAGTRAFVSSQNLGTPTAGPNAPGSRTVLIEPGFIYQWVWHNVQYNNGLQFQLPFDSIYFYRPCNNYDLNPHITTLVDGAVSNVAEPGQTVEFRYGVVNLGPTASGTVSCTIYANEQNGYSVPPGSPRNTTNVPGYVPPGTGCPRTFADGANVTLGTETRVAPPNRSICRSLFVDPAQASGGPEGVEACVTVANKPYFHVFGGDVSAGGGQTVTSGSCTNNAGAAIVGWNRGAAGGYAGAGAQFAALALAAIYDTSTAIGNSGGAPTPSGLAFANTGAVGSIFGGTFGSLPCIPNYYDTAGTSPLTTNNLATLSGVGRYAGNGPRRLNGTVNPNQKTVVYVDGDVLIDGNIVYAGSGTWNPRSIPLFQLVVRGNIYISRTVTQLDGVYIAQPNGASGGIIYTCANPSLPATAIATASPTFYSNCSNKLTVNGTFIANSVALLRTNGTQARATASETGGSTNIAEVFNYNPAFWIPQPPITTSEELYDSITSLPPIL